MVLQVDGLIGNLQEGAVPPHLQGIIERFELVIQLDVTRRTATSPWSWPVPGLGLLQELSGQPQHRRRHRQQQQQQLPVFGCSSRVGSSSPGRPTDSCSSDASSGQPTVWACRELDGNSSNGGASAGRSSSLVDSLELALLKPGDTVRLVELPEQVRVR